MTVLLLIVGVLLGAACAAALMRGRADGGRERMREELREISAESRGRIRDEMKAISADVLKETGDSLAQRLADAGVPIVGTPPEAIDLAEDRGAFGDLLSTAGLPDAMALTSA